MTELGYDFDQFDLGVDGSPDEASVQCDECNEEIIEGRGHWLLADDTRICVECHDLIYPPADPKCSQCGFLKHSHGPDSQICPVLVRGMLSMFQEAK